MSGERCDRCGSALAESGISTDQARIADLIENLPSAIRFAANSAHWHSELCRLLGKEIADGLFAQLKDDEERRRRATDGEPAADPIAQVEQATNAILERENMRTPELPTLPLPPDDVLLKLAQTICKRCHGGKEIRTGQYVGGIGTLIHPPKVREVKRKCPDCNGTGRVVPLDADRCDERHPETGVRCVFTAGNHERHWGGFPYVNAREWFRRTDPGA